MTEAQANTTRFCARVIGPLMVVIGAIVIVRAGDLAPLIPAILQDGPLAFVTGVFTLICGMVLIAAHHHWNNAAAIAISLLGVLTIVRGVTLMFAPSVLGWPRPPCSDWRPGRHHNRRDHSTHRRVAQLRRMVCKARSAELGSAPSPGGRCLSG